MYYQFSIFLNNVANVHWFLEMTSDKGNRKNMPGSLTVNLVTFRCQYNQRIAQNSRQVREPSCLVNLAVSFLELICWTLAPANPVAANLCACLMCSSQEGWRWVQPSAVCQETLLSVSLWQIIAEDFGSAAFWSSKASAGPSQGEGKGNGNNFTGIVLCARCLC